MTFGQVNAAKVLHQEVGGRAFAVLSPTKTHTYASATPFYAKEYITFSSKSQLPARKKDGHRGEICVNFAFRKRKCYNKV